MRLLTVKDVMSILNCSRGTVEKLYKTGTIPFIRNGRSIRFDPLDIQNYLYDNKE